MRLRCSAALCRNLKSELIPRSSQIADRRVLNSLLHGEAVFAVVARNTFDDLQRLHVVARKLEAFLQIVVRRAPDKRHVVIQPRVV